MADIHCSFDLETLHTRADGAILSIAAAARLPDGTLSTFYSPIKIESQPERMISDDTIAWWQAKGDLWQQTLAESEKAPPLKDALVDMAAWYASLGSDRDRLFPWGNGANFDIAFLEHAFDEQGVACPWAFWTGRDLRTVKMIAETTGGFTKPARVGTHHNALDDAITQLLTIEAALEAIYEHAA
jgi:hypothetical protein